MGLTFIKEIPLEGEKIISCHIISGPKTCAGKFKSRNAAGTIVPSNDIRFRCNAGDIKLGIVEDYLIETKAKGTASSGGIRGNPILFANTVATSCKQFDEGMYHGGKARLLHCCKEWDAKGECKLGD